MGSMNAPAPQDGGALLRLAATENLLVLVTRPGEETALCGALIAEACARGRPPLVAVLTDGSGGAADGAARAQAWEHALGRATERLGLPRSRLFLFGLHDGTAPEAGTPVFEALIRAVHFLMWSRDCGVVVAPEGGAGDHAVAAGVAAEVAARTGVRRVVFGGGSESLPLERPAWEAKAAAVAVHDAEVAGMVRGEVYREV